MPRPSARDIVDSVVQALHDSHEPLDEDVAIVPAIYDVMIHPQAYRELEPLLSRIKDQATQRLEREIERLNRTSGRTFGRILRPLLRLFYPEHRLRRLIPGAQKIERAGESWAVDILVTADHAARIDFLAVETDFGGRVSPVMRGDTGLHRRRTTRLPEGGYETILITPAGGLRRQNGSSTKRLSAETATKTTYRTEHPRAIARLDYEDRAGKHTYYFEKDRIVIGRHDNTDIDVALHTQADVSREHAVIRHREGAFEIQNRGRFGTRVNGRRLDPKGEWHPLPSPAEINLADAVIIHFKALPDA